MAALLRLVSQVDDWSLNVMQPKVPVLYEIG